MILIFVFGVPRFILVLQSNITGQTQWVSIIFTVMWFTPLIFLKKAGRKSIGLKQADRPAWLLYGFVSGMVLCLLFHLLFLGLFEGSVSNPFVYIRNSTVTGEPNTVYFLVYLAVVMTFSPIGEEFFYRGVIHGCFKVDMGEKKAAIIDSLAFSLTHLAHFGLIYVAGAWKFLPLPSFLWIAMMFLVCLIFNHSRRKSGSLLGAVLTHAGFNAAMGFVLFYLL